MFKQLAPASFVKDCATESVWLSVLSKAALQFQLLCLTDSPVNLKL